MTRVATVALGVALTLTAACGHPPARATTTATTAAPPAAKPTKPKRPKAKRPKVAAPDPPAAPAPPAATAVAPVTPATVARDLEHGLAAWYGSGRMTASGERFDKRAMAAAHRTLPFGTRVKVTATKTGRSVVVRINDRGPFGNKRRIIDLTEGAAGKLGIIDAGVAPVTIEILGDP